MPTPGAHLTSLIAVAPSRPGVYRFLASDGRVLYVGKARRLADRLASYLRPQSELHARTVAMLQEAADVAWVTCASEQEALLVEAAAIRDLQPPYNVRLRTDRDAYPYLAVTNHALPRIMTWHGKATGVQRFGPFPTPAHARELRDVVEQVWQLRPCRDSVLANHQRLERPCLLGEMGRCCAPCVNPAGYDQRVAQAVRLLDGHVSSTIDRLEDEMAQAAASRRFELAAQIRDRLAAVQRLTDRVVPTEVPGMIDVLAVATDDAGAAAQLLQLRDGTLRGVPTAVLDAGLVADSLLDSISDSLTPFAESSGPADLAQVAAVALYSDGVLPGDTVLVPTTPTAAFAEFIAALTDHPVTVRPPRSRPEQALVSLAQENARGALERERLRRASDPQTRREELTELASILDLAAPPLRLEAVDISHFAGTGTVSVVVVLEEGQPRPGAYRRFRLPDRNDDPASIAEVMRRRLSHLLPDTDPRYNPKQDWSLAARPGLILIDGGPTQLAAAHGVMTELGLDIPLAGLSKRLEEIWLPGTQESLRLPRDSAALLVLQRARDETHRASLAYQRRLRRLEPDLLASIPGLGPRRRQRLLSEAGSLRDLATWPRSRFESCTWLPAAIADAVYAALNPPG